MTKQKSVTVTREKLYQQVWDPPMTVILHSKLIQSLHRIMNHVDLDKIMKSFGDID